MKDSAALLFASLILFAALTGQCLAGCGAPVEALGSSDGPSDDDSTGADDPGALGYYGAPDETGDGSTSGTDSTGASGYGSAYSDDDGSTAASGYGSAYSDDGSETSDDTTGAPLDVPGVCGDGVKDDGEMCDGDDLDGVTCAAYDGNFFGAGDLACLDDCTDFDTSACCYELGEKCAVNSGAGCCEGSCTYIDGQSVCV